MKAKEKFYKQMTSLIDQSIRLSEQGRKAMVEKANLAAWEYFVMADATWKAYETMLVAYDRMEAK